MNLFHRFKNYYSRMRVEFPIIKQPGTSYFYMLYDYCMCYLLYGTVLDQYTKGGFYKLKGIARNKSVTYKRICKVYNKSINPKFVPTLEQKAHFNKHFSKFIKRKWLYLPQSSIEDFLEFVKDIKEVVVKPINGHQGEGIFTLEIPPSNEEKSKLFLELHAKNKDVIIEERLFSHHALTFNNSSLNTIRIHSIIDDNGNFHFMKFILRVGVGKSIVDNYCSGGSLYEIDEEGGFIKSLSYSKTTPPSMYHTGNKDVMIGKPIPFWSQVKSLIREAHSLLPEIKFIGWDVAITESGPELIEGNHHPDYDLLEFVGTRFWWPKFKEYLNL